MWKFLSFVAILAFIVWFVRKKKPEIVIPHTSLIDAPIDISIKNLPANVPITLEASCQDPWTKKPFAANAQFISDANGSVHLGSQAPLSGTYSGIDPMGLFWSMQPLEDDTTHFFLSNNKLEITFTLEIQGKRVTQKTIERTLKSPDIERKSVREEGLVGTLFHSHKKLPGVIIVPGSNGGIPETHAQILASHGYTVLALGYFGMEGLPPDLENIPLAYFQKAVHFLRQQTQVNEKVSLIGFSRGGELALLFASHYPDELNSVIAYVPSSFANGGFPYCNRPAWTPVTPFMCGLTSHREDLTEVEDLFTATKDGMIPFHRNTCEDPFAITDLFLARIKKYPETAAIPVENIRCPLLILSGEQDKIWPSTFYANQIMKRLDEKSSPIERFHLFYHDAGHSFALPYLPETDLPLYHSIGKFWCSLGGTASGNAHASKESWPAMLRFP